MNNDKLADLEMTDIQRAYKKLPADERGKLDQVSDHLKESLRQKKQTVYPGSQPEHIGDKYMLELMGKLGMWLVENDI